jgi:hypothetical protein
MKDVARAADQQSRSSSVRNRHEMLAAPSRPPAVARALALQRQVGNRVASRVLARWIKHPDPEQKGVMVPDVVAAELARFNPPKNE